MLLPGWTWFRSLPERALFGAAAERQGAGGALLRMSRWPYALSRDLIGGRLNLHAMGLVYATLLALIPLIAFSLGLLKAFNAQSVLQPLVYEFFRPMGDAATPLTARVMAFANKVRGGLIGSVGLALLIWTLIGTMKKVEDGFNFVWHVEVPRSFARRTAEYVVLLIMGPVLIAAVVGLSRLAVESAPLRVLSQLPLLDRLTALALTVSPYVIASGLLTLLYRVIPNTRVRWTAAAAGGIAAGVLWSAVGRVFTLFVLYSSRLTIVYAGFAIVIAALLWTYLGWLILLSGALVSFYVQNPAYLHVGLEDLELSGADTERLALSIMYLVAARHRAGGYRLDAPALAAQLALPEIAVARACDALESAGLLAAAEDGTLLPARDAGVIPVLEVLAVARDQSGGQTRIRPASPAVVEALATDLEAAWQRSFAQLHVGDLLERQI